jgi:hypothetical protein
MTEINKDELLDMKKWQRFFFMFIYSFAINGVASLLIALAIIQFIFYLFTSQTNAKLRSANDWLLSFFIDSVNFISFNTNSKPWPFSDDAKSDTPRNEDEIVEAEAVEITQDDNTEAAPDEEGKPTAGS